MRDKGFTLRVSPGGVKTWHLVYRANEGGRSEPKRRLKIGDFPAMSADEARKKARDHISQIRNGADPATSRIERRESVTLSTLANAFIDHVKMHLKASTAANYTDILRRIVIPTIGHLKAESITSKTLAQLHKDWGITPYQANRTLAVVSSMYSWGAGSGDYVPEDFNPTRKIQKYKEVGRSYRLSTDAYRRLGAAIREAETVGVPWRIDMANPGVKHLGKDAADRRTVISAEAAAAIRLLIYTGARLREILNLRWSEVDLTDAVLSLPTSKTGAKQIALSAQAVEVLKALERRCEFVFPGPLKADGTYSPRTELRRPWKAVASQAELDKVRIHDLRHSYATNAIASGEGIWAVSKLLGHSRIDTTMKYVHLDVHEHKPAADRVSAHIAASMGEGGQSIVLRESGPSEA